MTDPEITAADEAAQITLDGLRTAAVAHKRASGRHRREAARLMGMYESLYSRFKAAGMAVRHHQTGGESHG